MRRAGRGPPAATAAVSHDTRMQSCVCMRVYSREIRKIHYLDYPHTRDELVIERARHTFRDALHASDSRHCDVARFARDAQHVYPSPLRDLSRRASPREDRTRSQPDWERGILIFVYAAIASETRVAVHYASLLRDAIRSLRGCFRLSIQRTSAKK